MLKKFSCILHRAFDNVLPFFWTFSFGKSKVFVIKLKTEINITHIICAIPVTTRKTVFFFEEDNMVRFKFKRPKWIIRFVRNLIEKYQISQKSNQSPILKCVYALNVSVNFLNEKLSAFYFLM